MKVLEVGPSPTRSKGGMATVISEILEDKELNEKYDISVHASYKDGLLIVRLLFSVFSFVKFLFIYKQFDVFHIHTASYGSTFRKGYYIRFLKRHNKAVIMHVHGGKYTDFYNSLSERKKRRVEHIWKQCDTIIVLSDEWRKRFYKIFKIENLVVIHNGIEVSQYDDAVCDVSVYKDNFLFLGNIVASKGVYDLIEAVEIVKNTYPGVKVYLAGNGELHNVKRIIIEKNLVDNICVAGWLDLKAKIEIMQKVGTVVLPSYNEGLPMCILEGMAAGKVIIGTEVGAMPEVVTEENGILVSVGNIKALADAMMKVISDTSFDIWCSNNNMKKIRTEYNRKNMHEKISDIYNTFVHS